MPFYSVYDADGGFFRSVDEEQAELLIENKAAVIEAKRRKLWLRLTVDHSTARALLAPKFPVSQAGKTWHVEHIGDDRIPLYQHSKRCEGFGVAG